MQSIRSEIHDSVRTAYRFNGGTGRKPTKITEGKLKLAEKEGYGQQSRMSNC